MSFGLKAAQKPGPPLGRRRKTPPEVVPRYLLNIKPAVVPRVLLRLCGRWPGRAGVSLALYHGPVMYMREGDVALLLPSPAAGSSFPTFPFQGTSSNKLAFNYLNKCKGWRKRERYRVKVPGLKYFSSLCLFWIHLPDSFDPPTPPRIKPGIFYTHLRLP